MSIDHRRAQICMAQDRARQGERLSMRDCRGADRMTQRVRGDAGQLGLPDDFGPNVLGALKIAVAFIGGEHIVRAVHLIDALEQGRPDRS